MTTKQASQFPPSIPQKIELVSRITNAKQDAETVKHVMHDNIHKAFQNTEKISILVDASHELMSDAAEFEKSAKDLRRKQCMRNAKIGAGITLIVVIVILLIVASICVGGHC